MKQAEENDNVLSEVTFDEFAAPTYEEWKEEVTATLKGVSFEKKLLTKTYEGITLEPMFTMEMAPSPNVLSNFPGEENYMRGTHIGGYLTNPWKIAQQCGEVLPEELNKVIRNELDKGATSINIALDFATRHGKNAAEIFLDDVEKCGVSISTTQDMYEVFKDIDLSQHALYIDCGASAAMITGMLSAMLKANAQKVNVVHGMIGADPIGVLAEEGSVPHSLEYLFDEMEHTVFWAAKNMPKVRTILVRGETYSDGGASAVQELGYALSTAISYIRAMQLRCLDIDTIANHIQFSFALGSNFFMEIAKLRAAKMLWAKIVESFGGSKDAQKM